MGKKKQVKKKQIKKHQRKAYFTLSFIIAAIVLATVIVVVAAVYLLLIQTSFYKLIYSGKINREFFIFCLVLLCLIIGYAITFSMSRLIIHPIRKIISKMEQLASGNYDVRISFKGPIAEYQAFSDLTESFNKMARELKHTEILGNEFINNFSHEFKTPIVSIAGFAKLLREGNLTESQNQDYLKIIEEESLRLATMATNVLNLSKIENQVILTETTNYNLSEQIRTCMIMLESKWQSHVFDIQIDFDEFYITANEEMLKQVWLNILDNAIKFTPENSMIKVEIKQNPAATTVSITNTGIEISPESQKYIFNKFYQADKSHSSQGNGIGLAVAKKIVDLHKGNINVVSGNNKTKFIITLPAL